MEKKGTSVFSNGLIWFGAGVSLAEILTGTYFAPLGFGKAMAAILLGHLIGGLMMFAAGTSKEFNTGEWRTNTPVFKADLCKQCLLCAPVCPDSSIPVSNGKRGEFDLMHCKGCGICAEVCPFDAIEMKEGK